MSTKTLTKRVALATVVALGAGVLSLVTVTSASAVATDTLIIQPVDANGFTASTTVSSGLIAKSKSGLTSTATLASTGKLAIQFTSTTDGAGVSVVGGTITGADNASAGFKVTGQTFIATTDTTPLNVQITPNTGASVMYITTTNGESSSAFATSAQGTPVDYIVVSIAATNTAGILSLTKSGVAYAANGAGGDPVSLASPGLSDYAAQQYGVIKAHDAYDVKLLGSDKHYIQATASNGAFVSLNTSALAAPLTPSRSSDQGQYAGSADVSLAVKAGALAKTGGTTTVTVSVDGTVIGTIGYTFTGPVAKVVLSSAGNAIYNGATAASNSITIAYYDSLGNPIYFTAANGVNGNNAYPAVVGSTGSLQKDANGFKGLKTSMAASTSAAFPANKLATGNIYVTCPVANASDSAQVDYINADGTVVVSNSLPFTCSGAPYTYTAAFDKATYNPGEIATLSVTFKDASGALASDTTVGATLAGAVATVTAGYMSSINGGSQGVNVASATDVSTNGVAKYKFVVGQPAGTYSSQASVLFPSVTGTTDAVTVPYSITIGGTSLNDVLKGIVSLIASINKQIAALAKLVTKKK